MRNVKGNEFLGVCLAAMVLIIPIATSVQASSGSVKDCIQNDDCLENEKEPAANETDNSDNKADNESSGSGSLVISLIKMGFALLLVLGLIYGVLKFVNKRNKMFQQVKTLENIGGISLGPNKSIQLVRVGQKLYMVGVGDNVELLQEVTDEELKQELLTNDERQGDNLSSLLPLILPKKENSNKKEAGTNDFGQLFSAELDKLKRTRQSLISQRKEKDDQHE
ncbi:flagellar protein [Lentibacillus lipolyticus]|nr:flagellar protein [Lentibacillus lipolyticus]